MFVGKYIGEGLIFLMLIWFIGNRCGFLNFLEIGLIWCFGWWIGVYLGYILRNGYKLIMFLIYNL